MSFDTDLRLPRPPPLPAPARYAITLLLVGFVTLAAVLFDRLTQAPNLSLVFVLPVVIAAVSFGWGPSLMAAVLGALAFNFFLIAPRYTLRIADPANAWAFVLLLAVAALVSAMAAQARAKAEEAGRSAEQALVLRAMAQDLVGATDRSAIAAAGARALNRLFQAPAAVLLDGEDAMTTASAGGAVLSEADYESARWALAARLPARADAYPVENADYDFWPVTTAQRLGAVLGVKFSARGDGRPEEADRLVDIVAGYLSVALDRDHFATRALQNQIEIASQRLKGDLLAAVSHDLKTPLSTVLFTLQSLQRFDGQHDKATRGELLALAERETERLSGMVANLLNMGRLEEGAVVVHKAPLHAADLILGALAQAAPALGGRAVVREGEDQQLLADPQLAQTALANLLENAGKYAPAATGIHIRTGADGAEGWIEVADEGPGFPEPIEPLFGKFVRGVDGDGRAPGTGLGLAIARGFAEAQGGRVEAFNRPGGAGAAVRLILPLADGPS
ncbi:MAG: sensor histidine kinase [Caulobacteraceae bacterium]